MGGAATKYYISNNIMFLGGNGNMVDGPSSAVHYKLNDLQRIGPTKAKGELIPIRMFNNKNHRDYALMTPPKYLGKMATVVDSIISAEVFNSLNEAKDYAARNINIIQNIISDAVIIDQSFKKYPLDFIKAIVPDSPREDIPRNQRIKFTREKRSRIYSKYNGICQLCGKPVSKEHVSIDHIIPLSKGGTNDEDNLQLTHDICNRIKGSYTEEECMQVSTDMLSRYIINNPDQEISFKLVRSMVRGVNRYGSFI